MDEREEEERRERDPDRLKERVYALEQEQKQLARLTRDMHYALFGIRDDRSNNGLIGTMSEFRQDMKHLESSVDNARGAINRALIVILTAIVTTVVGDILVNAVTNGGHP